MKKIILIFLLCFSLVTNAQYPFEKYPAIKSKKFEGWKVNETKEKTVSTLSIPKFFKDGSLTLKTTSYPNHWFENSDFEIYNNHTKIQSVKVNMAFSPLASNLVYSLDINNDGLKDIKVIAYYMGCGLASLNVKVFYLLQKPDHTFAIISYDEKEGVHETERDVDGDGKFEIITMCDRGYKDHTYWVFNLYEFNKYDLVNANQKLNYPILIQFLYKDNFKITTKVSRAEMKKFAMKLPEDYSKQ